jgi:hypothetical protein
VEVVVEKKAELYLSFLPSLLPLPPLNRAFSWFKV